MDLTLHAGFHQGFGTYEDSRYASEAGFSGLEALVDRLVTGPRAVAPIRMMNCLIVRDEVRIADLRHVTQRAVALRAPLIQVVVLGAPLRPTIEHIRRSVPLRLSVEPVSFDPRPLSEYVEALDGRPGVGLCLDTWHLQGMGESPSAIAEIPDGMINHVHVADGYGLDRDDQRDCLPGDGVVRLRSWIDAIRETGYSGAYGVEVLGAARDPLARAREIRAAAERILD